MKTLSFKQLVSLLSIFFLLLLAASAISAWTGPTATAPDGNVAAPINVGTIDQVKDAGISVNALTVFGSQYIQSKLGINKTSPVVALHVVGTMILGNGGEVCQAVTEGGLRYNSTTKVVEVCNAEEWCPLSGCGVQPPTPQQTVWKVRFTSITGGSDYTHYASELQLIESGSVISTSYSSISGTGGADSTHAANWTNGNTTQFGVGASGQLASKADQSVIWTFSSSKSPTSFRIYTDTAGGYSPRTYQTTVYKSTDGGSTYTEVASGTLSPGVGGSDTLSW